MNTHARTFIEAAHVLRATLATRAPTYRTRYRKAWPYVFERNPRRFGHDRFVLCDRDYEPMAGTDGVPEHVVVALMGECIDDLYYLYDDRTMHASRAQLLDLYVTAAKAFLEDPR